MAYIDTTYVDNAVTQALRLKLTPTSNEFNQLLAMAEAVVNSALKHAGYQAPITGTAPDDVKLATFGVFIGLAYGRIQLDAPERYQWAMELVDKIREGTYPLLTVAPSSTSAVGGIRFTESDPSINTAVPQVFGVSFMRWMP